MKPFIEKWNFKISYSIEMVINIIDGHLGGRRNLCSLDNIVDKSDF